VSEQNEDPEVQDADGDVMVPALALHLLQASMSQTQATVDSLALTAWEQLRDLAHEALLFFNGMDKATETVTTRKIERILAATPADSWARTHEHASEMVRKMGGVDGGDSW
jgi:hypothetical protein